MLQVTPKETGVSYFLLRGTTVLAQGMLTWDAWEAALTVETNEILLEGAETADRKQYDRIDLSA